MDIAAPLTNDIRKQRIWIGTNTCGYRDVCVAAPVGVRHCPVDPAKIMYSTDDQALRPVSPWMKCANDWG